MCSFDSHVLKKVLYKQSCKNVPTVPTSRCYFFWPVLIFGKSTRKTGKNRRKTGAFLVLIFWGKNWSVLIFTPFATMESESFVNNSDLYHFGSFVSWSPAMQARAQKQQQQVRPFPLLLLCSISFPCPIWLDFSLMTTSFQPKCHDRMERLWPGMKIASSMARCRRRRSSRSPSSSFN